MPKDQKKYQFGEVSLNSVRNRNELRIIESMERFFSEIDGSSLTEAEIRDIYACALNLLPARYSQSGTIILGEPVKSADVDEAVSEAYARVISCPKS